MKMGFVILKHRKDLSAIAFATVGTVIACVKLCRLVNLFECMCD